MFPRHQATRHEDGGHVAARRRHQHPRDDLVARGNHHRRLATVGLQGELGSGSHDLAHGQDVMHPVSLGDSVAGRGHVELDRHRAGVEDRLQHNIGHPAQMCVSGRG